MPTCWHTRCCSILIPLILTASRAALLTEYVRHGGTLCIGARAGQKDETGQCVMQPMPGLLAPLTHSDVTDYTFVGPADEPVFMDWAGTRLDTGIFNDVLAPAGPDAEVLAVYTGNYYAGKPALLRRRVGSGQVLHFGGTFTRDTAGFFLAKLGIAAPWAAFLTLPACCELCVREKDGTRFFFVLNYAAQSQQIQLHAPMQDTETGLCAQGTLTLPPYGVKVFSAPCS